MACAFVVGTFSTAVVIIGIFMAIVGAIEAAKQEACNRARRDGYNNGYVKGKESEQEDWQGIAIKNGFAFRDPVYGRFTWKVAVKTAPVDLNDALPKAD